MVRASVCAREAMMAAIMDTHAVAWYILNSRQLSHRARRIFQQTEEAGNQIGSPTIVITKAIYQAELGQFPTELLHQLRRHLREATFLAEVPLSQTIAFRTQDVSRIEVPELADRIIAATALELGLPLISRDGKIRASRVRTAW